MARARHPMLMPQLVSRRELLSMLAACGGCATIPAAGSAFPGGDWNAVPAADGRAASSLRALLAGLDTTGMMVVSAGRAVFSYGDTTKISYLASARKSLVSMTYGPSIARGLIDPDATLASIGFDDLGGLLPIERKATIRDLLQARSGVYHPAANLGDASERAPNRGAVEPGSYFLYNNWDFNALGAIFERLTRRPLYQAFESDIARPIGLQDWDIDAQAVRNDTHASSHPAQHFVLSTRDMARLGLLMLRGGNWRGTEVIARSWIRQTTRIVTSAREVQRTSPFVDGLGYGYLWWIFDPAGAWSASIKGGFTASGAFGQFITVLPKLDLVIAHKTVAPSRLNVTPEDYFRKVLPAAIALVG
jgi:CubicO group peptidase (beta-lactamase class C family)